MNTDLHFTLVRPESSISEFVESFWMLQNLSEEDREIVVVPDGRMDLTISVSASDTFRVVLSGLETVPHQTELKAGTTMFAVSFKLLAVEYLIRTPIAELLDYAAHLPDNFWGFSLNDLENFQLFCAKSTAKIQSLLPKEMDSRKQKIFDLLYSRMGEITVAELAGESGWSSRQMNRYFSLQFGLSVKTYCNILRFRASFQHIKEGKLFPQGNFADQSHFIKAVKKLSGVSPKELRKNQNDRFIQFSVVAPE